MSEKIHRVRVTHSARHLRGHTVSGAGGGRVYFVDMTTGQLHACQMGPNGPTMPSPTPGVHPDDADEFAQFPGDFKVEAARGKKPPPPPSPSESSAASSPEDSSELDEDSGGDLPEDVDELTKAQWLELAAELELDVSADAVKARKPELVAHIRELYEEEHG